MWHPAWPCRLQSGSKGCKGVSRECQTFIMIIFVLNTKSIGIHTRFRFITIKSGAIGMSSFFNNYLHYAFAANKKKLVATQKGDMPICKLFECWNWMVQSQFSNPLWNEIFVLAENRDVRVLKTKMTVKNGLHSQDSPYPSFVT